MLSRLLHSGLERSGRNEDFAGGEDMGYFDC
jgi:hypothetical protein